MNELEAGRALDALIAEKVIGIPPDLIHTTPAGEYRETAIGRVQVAAVPAYSTDIAAAWQVVEAMVALVEQDKYSGMASGTYPGLGKIACNLRWAGPLYKASDKYLTAEGYPLGTTCWYVQVEAWGWRLNICADTAPLAICRAALAIQSADAMQAARSTP